MRSGARHDLFYVSFLLFRLLAPSIACHDISIGSDTGGGSAGGAGGATACEPGVTLSCYSGPPGTEGIGKCTGGTRICNGDGIAYGPCLGETVPSAEICDLAMNDEDCDGQVNEDGAGCCGNGVVDPGESCDDGNTMGGDGCEATCYSAVVEVVSYRYVTCALLTGGKVKCWGHGAEGQLGQDTNVNIGDQPGELGGNLPAIDLGTGKIAVSIAASPYHACALLHDGSVKCWGNNAEGVLGLGDTENRGDDPGEMGDNLPAVDLGTGKTAVAIAAGWAAHTCAILDDGGVKCWGSNSDGQLGLGDTENRGDDPNEMGDNLAAVDLGAGKTVVAVTTLRFYSANCALLNDGGVKCWGRNFSGQLGLGDTEDRGDEPGEMGDNLPAIDFGSGRTAVSLGANCVLLDDDSVKCWGFAGYLGLNEYGNRGDAPDEMGDSLPVVDLGMGKKALSLARGEPCALLNDGGVKCWGDNNWGQLGQGDTNSRGDWDWITGPINDMGDELPAIDFGTGLMISSMCSGDTKCAIFTNGRMKCWGLNNGGELGLGDTEKRGDQPGEMGDNLPFVTP